MTECLGCELIQFQPVTLMSGTVVCSSCEAWRHECEVRHVASLPSKADRARYLQGMDEERRKSIIEGLRAWGTKTEGIAVPICEGGRKG